MQSSTETTIAMDGALTQRTRLEEAHSGMDEILSIGRESLTGMRSQYSILKVCELEERNMSVACNT